MLHEICSVGRTLTRTQLRSMDQCQSQYTKWSKKCVDIVFWLDYPALIHTGKLTSSILSETTAEISSKWSSLKVLKGRTVILLLPQLWMKFVLLGRQLVFSYVRSTSAIPSITYNNGSKHMCRYCLRLDIALDIVALEKQSSDFVYDK